MLSSIWDHIERVVDALCPLLKIGKGFRQITLMGVEEGVEIHKPLIVPDV